MTIRANGLSPTGWVPALTTSNRSPARCRSHPSAIWLRHEFPVHRKSTFFFIAPLLVETSVLSYCIHYTQTASLVPRPRHLRQWPKLRRTLGQTVQLPSLPPTQKSC